MSQENETPVTMKLLIISLGALITLFGVTFSLLLDRMNKQEITASLNISTLREEIKTTKADAKDAVSVASTASRDAVVATASALKDAVAATAASSKEATGAIATALADKITILSSRVDRLELWRLEK